MKRLSKGLVLQLHDLVIQKSGGSREVRDISLLDSALKSAFQTFDGQDLYPSDLDKIVMISYSLIQGHPFIDGNKRIGILILALLLKENGYSLTWTDEDLVFLGLSMARGQMDPGEVKSFILKKLNKGIKGE